MRAVWTLLAWIILCGTARAGGLDVRGWLDRPGTRLLVVEFYATWCKPCMQAVPRWKALHEKYRSKGLRLVVVNTMDHEGQCVNPGWMPDEMVCDPEGQIAEAFGLQGKLPSAFLWSWQGDLLVGKGHVEEVEKLTEQYLARSPRVLVEVAKNQRSGQALRDLVREQLASRGKLELVVDEDEARKLIELKVDSYREHFDDRLQCELGREVPANSLLRVTVGAGKQPRLGLMLLSAESGCLLAAASASWQKEDARRTVAEAVDKLLSRLRSDLQLPGVAEHPAVRQTENAKRKALLWLDFAQSPFSRYTKDKLKAYGKAIELDPELAAAYLGRADSLALKAFSAFAGTACNEHRSNKTECLRAYEEKNKTLQNALSDLERAISLDDSNAEAYAQRVEVLSKLKENQLSIQSHRQSPGDAEAVSRLDLRIKGDINRAIALRSRSRPCLYERRALLHAEAGEPDKAVADMTQAILAKEAEPPGSDYRGAKPLAEYYLLRARLHKGPDQEEKRRKDRQKGLALHRAQKKKREGETKSAAALLENSELGRLRYELEVGYLERATGLSIKSMKGWSANRPTSVQQEVIKKIKERIQRGQATGEEYLFMAGPYVEEDEATTARYLAEGIRLLRSQASDGVKAMHLVAAYQRKAASELYPGERLDAALASLDEARAVIERHPPRVLSQFAGFVGGRGNPPRELLVEATRLGKEDAQGLFWWEIAISVGRERVRIYEKLGIGSKARGEYKYLCSLKDEDACRSFERLK